MLRKSNEKIWQAVTEDTAIMPVKKNKKETVL
jgi:hypothetical protein